MPATWAGAQKDKTVEVLDLSQNPSPLGREAELVVLDRFLRKVAAGSSGAAIVEGEAGIGKTCLVACAAERATVRGFQTAWGSANELGRDRPFGPIADALGQLGDKGSAGADVNRLLAGDDSSGLSPLVFHAPGARFQILEAVVAAVEEVATAAPVLLVLEDLHWADPSTLLAIEHIHRRLAHLPVAVLATLRSSPHPPELDRFTESLRLSVHLQLRGLDEPSVAHLVGGLVRGEAGPALLALVAGAGGNPLFVTELVAALCEEGAVDATGDVQDVVDDPRRSLPPTFRLTALRRLSFLPEVALDLLRTASILGVSFTVDDLAVVLGLDGFDVLQRLAEPLRAGLLSDAGDRLAFRHELVREAIYGDLPASARRAVHLQVARRLGDAGRPSLQVARHFLLGALPGDHQAVSWLRDAGLQAAGKAPGVAVELFQGALSLAGGDDPLRDLLESELGVTLVWSGDVGLGEERLRALLDRPHLPSVHVATTFALARALLLQGKAQACVELLGSTVDNHPLAAGDRSRFLAEQALAHIVSGAVEPAATVAEQARSAAVEAGDDASLCLGMNIDAVVLGLRGDPSKGIAVAERAVALSLSSADREASRIPPQLMLAGLLFDVDRLPEGLRMLETARRISEEFGTVWDLPVYHLLAGTAHFHAGDDEDAVAEVEASLALASEVGTRVNALWAHAILAHVAIRRGDLAGAEASTSAGEVEMAAIGPQVRGTDWLLWARALLLEATGASESALALLRMLWDALDGLGIVSEHTLLGPDLVRLSLAAGEQGAAVEVARAVQAAADRNGSAAAAGAGLRCAGLAQGDPEPLLAAVVTYERSQRAMERALACEDAGVALGAGGRPKDARVLLERALEVFRDRRARRAEARTAAALRDLGVRAGARGPRMRPATGWDALTASEVTVTHLAAQGLTNPEIGERMFISRRTVESHLSHVFSKLAVSSRVELAGLVARRQSRNPV